VRNLSNRSGSIFSIAESTVAVSPKILGAILLPRPAATSKQRSQTTTIAPPKTSDLETGKEAFWDILLLSLLCRARRPGDNGDHIGPDYRHQRAIQMRIKH
jgi:hypothetical protein